MSDTTLRDLERAAAAGDETAAEKLTVARARAGMLGEGFRLATPLEERAALALAACASTSGTFAKTEPDAVEGTGGW